LTGFGKAFICVNPPLSAFKKGFPEEPLAKVLIWRQQGSAKVTSARFL
jgi:hypothetical protein